MPNSPSRWLFWTLGFPIALVRLLEASTRRLVGENWSNAGFGVATGFLGNLALWILDRPWTHSWQRCLAWIACWAISILAVAWFFGGGFCAILLIPLLRQGSRLDQPPEEDDEPTWSEKPLWFRLERLDKVSLGLIAGAAAMLLSGMNHMVPDAFDAYYHAQVARSILEHGAIPTWDDWSYAPYGRPHLYPPLLHVIIAISSLPFDRDVFGGLLLLKALWPPMFYFSTWYAARWFFDARRAFLAFLIAGSSLDVMIGVLGSTPSILAGNFALFLLVFFMKRRLLGAVCLATLGLYTHNGIIPIVAFGLFLFSIWNREYLRFFILFIALTALCYSPWLYRVWLYSDWFAYPGAKYRDGLLGVLTDPIVKIVWLLFLNVVIALLAARGLRLVRWNELRNRLFVTQALGFLPMLFSYGGRYFAHTTQFWVMFAALPLVRFLDEPLRTRRIALFVLLAFCPTLLFQGPELADQKNIPVATPLGYVPMVSLWMMPPAAALRLRSWFPNLPNYHRQAQEVAEFILQHAEPGQIIHCTNFGPLGLRVAAISGIPFSTGAFQEVAPDKSTRQRIYWFETHDSNGIFVALDESRFDFVPDNIIWTEVAGAYVGMPRRLVPGR